MTERDILLPTGLDGAIAAVDDAARSLSGRFVITDFGDDHRTGHIERDGIPEFDVVLIGEAPRTIARIDVRDELGQALARRLENPHSR